MLLSLTMTHCTLANEIPVLFQEEGKYGFKNSLDEVVIPAEYVTATSFKENGLALVSQDVEENGWPFEHGYIDTEGNVVVPLLYQQLTDFIEGFALAQKDGLFGFVTDKGIVAVDFIYEEAAPFANGKAVVKLDGVMQVITRPNMEESSIAISEADYIMIRSPYECLEYLSTALSNGDGGAIGETDQLAITKLLQHVMGTMPSLNAQVQGSNIMILSENYASVVSSSQEIKQKYLELLELHEIEPTPSMNNYFSLMERGIGNVLYEGVAVATSGEIDYVISPFPVPYFDPNVYKSYTTNVQFNSYLSSRLASMGGAEMNISGAEGLVAYINHIFINLEPYYFSTGFNKVEVGTEKQKDYFRDAYNLTTEINSSLAEHNVSLAVDMSNELLLLVDGNNLEKPVKFQIHKDYLYNYLGLLGGIRIVIGNQGQGVYLPAEELKYILSTRDQLIFELDFSASIALSNVVHLTFYEEDGKTVLHQVPEAIFVTMPTSSPTASVFAFIEGQNSENWGGLVKLNNTIEFATTFTGEYVAREAQVEITDIGELSIETQEKIEFMVTQGFFKLNGSEFNPEGNLTRVELVTSLVKLFFEQDSTAKSNFADVSSLMPDYPMISAAYQAGIASGYEDNTFRGANITTKEEIVTFLTRTLETRKGYKNIENPYEVIQVFSDWESIPEWAVSSVALAVEHNLIDSIGPFNGESEVSRKEAAQLLYTLFFKLYDTSNQNVNFYNISEGRGYPIFLGVFAIIAVIIALIAQKIKARMDAERAFKERMSKITTTIGEDVEFMVRENRKNDLDPY